MRVEVVSEDDRLADELDAIAIEDDTYAVLSADPAFKEPAEHPIRIWTAVHEAEPARPGSVTVKPGHPLLFLAVVHDLSADPTWTEQWIAGALDEIFRLAVEHDVRTLCLPVLGAVHGRLPLARFTELLGDALRRGRPSTLETLWLVAPSGAEDELKRLVASPE